tara:strand:+ start:816 stop:1154 length:339 start_codon:yes stop_codon:yes gene_type:complete
MKIDLTFDELNEVLASLRMSAHEANRTANNAQGNGYPPAVASELSSRAGDLYLLADKIDDQTRRTRPTIVGSSETIDPFDTLVEDKTLPPKGSSSQPDSSKTPNDPPWTGDS